MKSLLGLVAIFAATFSTAANAETLSNADVIGLLEAGLGEEAVVAKIETADGVYDTDTDTLISLSAKGVPSSVIAAMVKRSAAPEKLSDSAADPMVPHYAGVYLMDSWSDEPRMWKIDPTSSSQTKTGGIFGYALTGGIASASVKAVIPGEAARFASPMPRPVFYVYMNTPDAVNSGTFSTGFGGGVQSPNEFSLVKFKERKGRREARIGSLNIAGAKAGVMDKDRIPFSYEQVSPGVFKMVPDVDLDEGEYGFIFALGGGVGPGLAGSAGTAGARVFAFGIE